MSDYTATWSGPAKVDYVPVSNGARLRFLTTGTGPSLVLLHTLRTQLDYFQRLIPRLIDHFTVHAVDLPGLGWSDIRAGASYEEPAVRRSVVEFVERLGLDNLTLAGESMGATLSLSASTELGSRIKRVVAINTYDYPQGLERANLLASIVVKAMRIPVFGLVFSKLENTLILGGVMRGGFFDPRRLPEDLLAEQLRSAGRPGYALVECGYYRALPSYIAARRLYPGVNLPVTLIYGDHDWSKPLEREAVAQLVSGSQMITLADTGHFASLERPDEVARILIGASATC